MKNNKLKSFGIVFLVLIPALLVFRAFFTNDPLAAGDAPHFYPLELKEILPKLLPEPHAWTNRGNNFGGVDPRIWIYPVLLVYSGFNQLLGMGNEIIIRLIFYFPGVLLAGAGPYLLTRFLGYSKKVGLFASLVYLFNTYFLLVVDGGQVGIALAYGLFPIALLFLKKLFDESSFFGFWKALILLFILTVADPRVALIVVGTSVLWITLEGNLKKNLKSLFLLSASWIGLSAYWIIPLLRIGGDAVGLSVSELQLVSVLDSLTLFSSHWPQNIFGQVVSPPFYFVGIPILIFSGLLISRKRKVLNIALMFLIFAFLAKGKTPPLGGVYEFITSLPFGFAFRDSTKFYIPLILLGGILTGNSVEVISEKLRESFTSKKNAILGTGVVVYLYILLLMFPALLGKLNFVLSGNTDDEEIRKINQEIINADGFFRTAWFPERHPLTFETNEKPALDAKGLVDKRPFANMNVGSFDRFNFMHNENFIDWMSSLGIKYLVFSDDPRVVDKSEEQQELWEDLNARVATASGLVRKDWSDDLPVYEVPEVRERVYSTDKILAVVGEPVGEIPIPAVYFEDGLLEPERLEGIASESATLVFNEKSEKDLQMSFLKDYYQSPLDAKSSEWAIYSPDRYLEAKYQLLIREVDYKEFDYGGGIAFSDNPGEVLEFKLDVPQDDNYILAARVMRGDENSSITITLDGQSEKVESERIENFEWFTKGTYLEKGEHELAIKNNQGLSIINMIGLIPNADFQEAQKRAETFMIHFEVVEEDGLEDFSPEVNLNSLEYQDVSPVRYEVESLEDANWIIFTDSYHPLWRLQSGKELVKIVSNSVPIHSVVNGFYVESNSQDLSVVFSGQEQVRWGIYFSGLTALFLVIIFLWYYPTYAGRPKTNEEKS